MKTFIQFVKEDANDELYHLTTHWKELGANVFVYLNNDTLQLHSIKVKEEKRGQGVGSTIMWQLLRFAQDNKYRITLSPSTDLGASSISRLEKFYKKFGFVHNKGRNKDYSISDTMIWEPKH